MILVQKQNRILKQAKSRGLPLLYIFKKKQIHFLFSNNKHILYSAKQFTFLFSSPFKVPTTCCQTIIFDIEVKKRFDRKSKSQKLIVLEFWKHNLFIFDFFRCHLKSMTSIFEYNIKFQNDLSFMITRIQKL